MLKSLTFLRNFILKKSKNSKKRSIKKQKRSIKKQKRLPNTKLKRKNKSKIFKTKFFQEAKRFTRRHAQITKARKSKHFVINVRISAVQLVKLNAINIINSSKISATQNLILSLKMLSHLSNPSYLRMNHKSQKSSKIMKQKQQRSTKIMKQKQQRSTKIMKQKSPKSDQKMSKIQQQSAQKYLNLTPESSI